MTRTTCRLFTTTLARARYPPLSLPRPAGSTYGVFGEWNYSLARRLLKQANSVPSFVICILFSLCRTALYLL